MSNPFCLDLTEQYGGHNFFADFSPDNSHEKPSRLMIYMKCQDLFSLVVGWCEGVMYLLSPGRPADIGL